MDNSISLPLDIELIIIDALADLPDFEERQDYTERQECFRSLSLVCRNWTRPSQKYLFNTVQLDHISLPKFESVIMPQTELAKSFRESVVQLTFNSSLSTAKASKDWKVEKPTFSIARALMIALTLPKVATLDFKSRGFSLEPPILHRLPPRFGNVRCLAIQIKEPVRLSHLAHFLSGFSSLHTLRIDVAIEPEPKDVEGKKPLLRYKYPSLPTTLYRLFLYVFPGSEPLIEWLMSAYGRTAELYDFTVIIPDCGQTDYTGEFNALQCVLDDCGPNLCSFDLFIDIDSKDFNPPPLYLRENSELEDITYKVVGVPMLQYVVEQLRTLDESTAVSQLAIDYCSNGKPSEPIWMLLDRITENKAMFPLNGRLAVAYHENGSKEEREHNVEKWCQETLPRCMPSLWQRDALIWEDWLWEDPTYSSFLNRD